MSFYTGYGYNPDPNYGRQIMERAQDNRMRSQREAERLAESHSLKELDALLEQRLADPAHDIIGASAKATVVSEARRAIEIKRKKLGETNGLS